MRITYLVEKVGPYHAFRLGEIKDHEITVIETRPQSERYAWKENISIKTYGLSSFATKVDLEKMILDSKPEGIFITGYGFKEMLWALSIGIKNHIPLSLLSDTTYMDEPKNKVKEIIKTFLVTQFQSALVAGTRSRNYLLSLKMSAEHIYQPYDIVDNQYYSERSANFTNQTPYFLCVSRLIPAKNLVFLIKTFAVYRTRTGDDIDLIILGNGPLESELRLEIQNLGMEKYIHLKGFLINDEVRKYYQNAQALILASTSEPWGLCINEAMAAGTPVIVSTRAGASEDLIEEGRSGFLFSPDNSDELIHKMTFLRKLSPGERKAIILEAGKKIESFDINHFRKGFNDTAQDAQKTFKKKSWKFLRSSLVNQLSRFANS